MISNWTKNLKTGEEKQRFENSLKGSKVVLDRLLQLLNEEEQEIDRTDLSLDQYEAPGWAAKLAHRNGQRASLRKIKTLINLDQQKDNNELTRKY